MNLEPFQVALRTVNHISAMVAYWDSNQRCVFSNDAYREWFGKSPEQMVGMSMKELLGPLYEKNLPYILAALRGEKQVFERQIPLPGGEIRESIATYTPDIVDGVVRGFSVHVADVTILRAREAALERALRERDDALADVRTLRGLLPICASCKRIRDAIGTWQPIEKYVAERSEASFSHSICPECMATLYPDINPTKDT
jgi:PAS domain S-box-containing protein